MNDAHQCNAKECMFVDLLKRQDIYIYIEVKSTSSICMKNLVQLAVFGSLISSYWLIC